MGPEVVVLEAPLLDEYLRLEQRVEALTVEALVPEPAVKRLDGAILPGAARLDEERLHGHALEPVTHGLGGELGAVVRADVGGNSAPHEALGEAGALLDGGEPSGNDDCEALARVLIDDHEELQRSPIGSALEDEVGQWYIQTRKLGALYWPARPQRELLEDPGGGAGFQLVPPQLNPGKLGLLHAGATVGRGTHDGSHGRARTG